MDLCKKCGFLGIVGAVFVSILENKKLVRAANFLLKLKNKHKNVKPVDIFIWSDVSHFFL